MAIAGDLGLGLKVETAMKRSVLGLPLCLLALAGFASSAGAMDLDSGFWELTGKIERDGVVSERPPSSRCISAKAAAAARSVENFALSASAAAKLEARFGKDGCRLVRTRNSKDIFIWWLSCDGNPGADQTGSARLDGPRHFVVEISTVIHANGRNRSSMVTIEGRHKGECPR